MSNNLYNKVSADMILKKEVRVEELGGDLDYALAQELLRNVNETQRKLKELNYKNKSGEGWDIYITI